MNVVSSKHLGIDLPVGGLGNPVPTTGEGLESNKDHSQFIGHAGVPYRTPARPVYSKDIQHGHLYVQWKDFGEEVREENSGDLSVSLGDAASFGEGRSDVPTDANTQPLQMGAVLLGIEASAPLKKDLLGGVHGADASSNPFSAFGKHKWERYNATRHGVPAGLGGIRINVDERRLRQLMLVLENTALWKPSDGQIQSDNFGNLSNDSKTQIDDERELFKNILQSNDAEAQKLLKHRYGLQRHVKLSKRASKSRHASKGSISVGRHSSKESTGDREMWRRMSRV